MRSVQDLATRMGYAVHPTRLGEIERGTHRDGFPRAATRRAIEDALGWSVGDTQVILAGGEPTPVDQRPAAEPVEETVTVDGVPVRVVFVQVPAADLGRDGMTGEQRREAAERLARQYQTPRPGPDTRESRNPGSIARPA